MLYADKLFETETPHRRKKDSESKAVIYLQVAGQNRYCPNALISVELSFAGKPDFMESLFFMERNYTVSFPVKNKKISQHFRQIFPH